MNKIIALLLAMVMVFALVACGSNNAGTTNNGGTTTTPTTPDDPDAPVIEEMTATLGLPAQINAGDSFNAVISIDKWDNEAGYKLIDFVMNIPAGITVTNVAAGSRLAGGEVSWNQEAETGKLRVVYFDANENNTLTISGEEFPAELFTITFNTGAGSANKLDFAISGMSVKLTSDSSEYALNLSPINKEDQTAAQRLDIPSVRILEGTEQVTVPIKQLIGDAKLNSALAPTSDEITFRYDAVVPGVLEYIEFLENRIAIVDAPEQLEPGKDYLMRMAFYNADGQAYDEDCRVGFAYFYLSIVPKKVEWTGQFNNDWGDDRNWQGVKEDGSLMEGYAYAPLPETNVIIPADKPVPTITATDAYPMDVNHHPNACNKIYFEPGAMIGNQHLLQYNQAFVDMLVKATTWHSMAAPMQGMYSGDMYIPHSGNYSSGTNLEYENTTDNNQYPFVVNSFQGARSSSAAYAFWQSIYNKRVPTYHENGNQSYPSMTETEQFLQTNSLGYELKPGTGYQLLGYGPTVDAVDLIIRLPKPDTYYSYYTNKGEETGQRAYVTHSPKLAFTPDANGNMRITLTSDVASNKFMFGNPTMANINMKEFLLANADVVAAYYVTMDNSSWNAETLLTNGENKALLPPMRSAMLQLKDGMTATSITLTLSANHLETGSEVSDVAENMPARRQAPADEASTQVMNIYSYSNRENSFFKL